MEERVKKQNEKNPTHSICSNVRFRVRIARMRVHRTAYGRDTPLCAYRFWRDSHFQRLVDRHRLPLPLQRIITPSKIAVYYTKLLKIYISEIV